jgi:hypothetical protein
MLEVQRWNCWLKLAATGRKARYNQIRVTGNVQQRRRCIDMPSGVFRNLERGGAARIFGDLFLGRRPTSKIPVPKILTTSFFCNFSHFSTSLRRPPQTPSQTPPTAPRITAKAGAVPDRLQHRPRQRGRRSHHRPALPLNTPLDMPVRRFSRNSMHSLNWLRVAALGSSLAMSKPGQVGCFCLRFGKVAIDVYVVANRHIRRLAQLFG